MMTREHRQEALCRGSIRIKIPRTNIFSVEALVQLLHQARERKRT